MKSFQFATLLSGMSSLQTLPPVSPKYPRYTWPAEFTSNDRSEGIESAMSAFWPCFMKPATTSPPFFTAPVLAFST